ncbi:biotin--[acetyl-CoA-carboxylase] ligase [Clostridium bovifaecis]|uniref:Bifunctional ligase/repressor BirA n=1 Tax=Clostridium bovifaecis TaxID=2184719 RepID=A0A6I6F0C8_9CLOT|nr:biotin--[acetyl-CoA-carboxylase] ligase [Clostridium bovifaecis]
MKEEIISLLKENENSFISGEKISSSLGVTRAAIWKHIKAIREDGYEIESVSRKGYRLISSPDLLSLEEIKPSLTTKLIGKDIKYLDSIDSTNNEAKRLASEGTPEGTIVISEEQISGRGRLGRNWVSLKYKGIWMSIILRPDIEPMYVPEITQIAAAAVCKVTRELGIETYIKWSNDIILNYKKVCGILTEMSGEINKVNYVVVGIGMNVNIEEDEFPEEVKSTATSLKIEQGVSIRRKELVAKILNKFEELYEEFITENSIKTSIEICRRYSILIGKNIRIINRGNETIAEAIGLSDEGKLIVRYENGKVEEIISGEVSVRGLHGYV